MSQQQRQFDSHICGEPGCGRRALIWTHGKKANRKIHTDPKYGLCFRHWRAEKSRQCVQAFAMLCLFFLLVATGKAQTLTTTVIGNFRDTTGAIVPNGQVTFELQPGIDTTISGNARFGPQTTTCTINASTAFSASGVVRASNVVTVTFTAPHPFLVGDTITVSGMADTSYNGTFTVATVADSLHITWSQTGANSSTGGGVISALRNSSIVAPCKIVQNTSLQPQGTSYKVSVWPGFAQTSSFIWYAIGAGPVDLSTVVPTPAGLPAYAIVDTFSNQTINGNKTFNGTVTILGALNLPGAATFTGSAFISSSASPAATGIFRVASGDLALCWRNNANTGDLCFTKTAGDALQFNGSPVGTGGTVTSVAQTVPSWLTVSGSPITTSGTLAITATGGQGANNFVATPCGSAGGVALRILCNSDAPSTWAIGGVAISSVPQMVWSGAIVPGNSTAGAIASVMDTNTGGIKILNFRVALDIAYLGCSPFGQVEIFDETAGAAVAGSAITLSSGSTVFSAAVNQTVPSSHVLDFRSNVTPAGCTQNGNYVGMAATFNMQ